uniref:Uncharacterized protein n=1 Tax=Rhizophagus irregularis (strain DAOM 181602 / DAOM 197198 / MUCL 43194) TaxID=747089 RepID=U9U1S7_RHIID
MIPEKIIILELAEASKFSYIVGWIVYKLTKSDNDVQSQTTNVIPGKNPGEDSKISLLTKALQALEKILKPISNKSYAWISATSNLGTIRLC